MPAICLVAHLAATLRSVHVNCSCMRQTPTCPCLITMVYWWPPMLIKTSSSPLTTCIPLYLLLLLTLSFHSHFLLHLCSRLMKTCTRNKSKHPAAPIMTPSQLSTAGISTPNPKKKLTKDQRILTLEEDLCLKRELLRTAAMFISLGPNLLTDFVQNNSPIAGGDVATMPQSPDHDGDTEPATDDDSSYTQASSKKRKPRRPASGGVRYVGDVFNISSLTTLM